MKSEEETIQSRNDLRRECYRKKTGGEMIRRARKKKDYSQQELADILGVSKATISLWETDRAWPMRPRKLSAILEIPLDDLVR
jgi:transcriptional regulator with XRE-family HTH domain